MDPVVGVARGGSPDAMERSLPEGWEWVMKPFLLPVHLLWALPVLEQESNSEHLDGDWATLPQEFGGDAPTLVV